MSNLKLWDSVAKTDPAYATDVKGGGFSYTSANAYWQIRRATEKWGPCGTGWSVSHKGQVVSASDNEKVWVEDVTITYRDEETGQTASVTQYGVAKFCYMTSGASGYFKVDEQAPKKALTNGISKALSMLGFSADLWLKYYNSKEYIESVREDFERDAEQQKESAVFKRLTVILHHAGADAASQDEEFLCRFWTDGKYGIADTLDNLEVAREVLQGQAKKISEFPAAKHLEEARKFADRE